MKHKYTLEIGFLVMVIAVSLVGFSSLALGEQPMLDAYHVLHIITSLAWLLLLLTQIVFIRQHRFRVHRTIGTSIFAAGPVLVASLTLMTVHSAAKDAVMGRADDFVVQNVVFAVEVALLCSSPSSVTCLGTAPRGPSRVPVLPNPRRQVH